ncbi:MAG: transcriptional repressor [Ruminococcaceae bacterium]|nr:transcriptional repressor [Oscillospiraceae bacterium]
MKKERNTYQKSLIKDVVLNTCTHPSADAVYDKVKEVCPNVSKATVYRVLNDLADKGEVYRVRVLDGPDRYDKTIFKHYHVKCASCGRVVDTMYTTNEDIEKVAGENCEFKITGHEIIFEGICPECANNNK